MAELKFTILADLKKLKSDIQKLMKEKFNIGVGKGNAGAVDVGGSKENKKQTGLLGGILGKVAIVAGILAVIKPIADIIKFVVSLLFVSFLRLLKWTLNTLPGILKNIWVNIVEWLKIGWEFVKELPGKIWEFVKELPGKIWEFVKELVPKIGTFIAELPEKIWKFIIKGFKALLVLGKIVAKLLWNMLLRGFTWIKDKLKSAIKWIKGLPEAIWLKLKALGGIIASAIANIIKSLISKKKEREPGEGNKDDFISRPGQAPVSFSPQDTIIGTKSGEGLGGQKVFNFFGVTPQEMIDVLKREFGVDVNKSGRF